MVFGNGCKAVDIRQKVEVGQSGGGEWLREGNVATRVVFNYRRCGFGQVEGGCQWATFVISAGAFAWWLSELDYVGFRSWVLGWRAIAVERVRQRWRCWLPFGDGQ